MSVDTVEPVQQRKRKISEHIPNDADADQHRKRKIELLAQEDRDEEMAEVANGTNAADDEIVEQPDEELITGKSFNMKKFREKLRDGDFIFELRHFLQTAAENAKIVGQYLKVGGKPLELVQSLERMDKTQLFHVAHVFNALQLTLIEILSESTQHTQPAIQACAYLLNSHRTSIEALLHSNVAQHKRTALKLLTAIVTLQPDFGRDILHTLSAVFNAENLAKFTRHSGHQIDAQRCGVASVRTCYIHFVLAYVIEGNAMLVRNLLDRNDLVLAVCAGLMYDDAETVALVLGTLTRFVLRSMEVSKTKKVQVFNVPVVRHLLGLYEWRGPAYFAATLDRKRIDRAGEFVDADELASVQQSVHEFLIILLTSRKHGIAFQSLGKRGVKSNTTQYRVLGNMTQPWRQPLKAELTITLLRACPELVRVFVKNNVAPALDMKSKQADWSQASAYLTTLINRLDASVFRWGLTDMSALEMGRMIRGLCLSPEVLQQLRSKFTLRSDVLRTRLEAALLVQAMLRQATRHLNAVETWQAYGANDMRRMQFDLLNHVFVMCPSVENIMLALHQTLQADAVSDDGDVQEMAMRHLEVVLDLLLLISATMPTFIEQTASVINYIKILRPIYELNRERASSTRIELKAVRLILALEPKALSLRTEFFQQVMHSVLNVFRLGIGAERTEAKRLLRGVFANTGQFENGALEVDLWLEALCAVDADDFEDVRAGFVEALLTCDLAHDGETVEEEGEETKKKAKSSSKRKSLSKNAVTTGKSLAQLFANIEKGISLDGNIDIPVVGRFYINIATLAREADSDSALAAFIDRITIALFHYLPDAQGVQAAVYSARGPQHKHAAYMRSWLTDGSGALDTSGMPAVDALYAGLVSKSVHEINLLDESTADALQNETHCMQLLYTAIFVLIQRAEVDCADKSLANKTLTAVKQILTALQNLKSSSSDDENVDAARDEAITTSADEESSLNKALRYVYCSRYQLLNTFSVLQENALTAFVFELTRYLSATADSAADGKTTTYTLLAELTAHFRMKLTNQIVWFIRNDAEATSNADKITDANRLLEMLNVFPLEHKHCVTLVQALIEVPVERYGDRVFVRLLSFVLRRLTTLHSQSLADETIAGIGRVYEHLLSPGKATEIATDDVTDLEEALHDYLLIFYDNIGPINAARLLPVVFASLKRLSDNTSARKSTIRLCALLAERDCATAATLHKLLPENVARKEVIYPLLNALCRQRHRLGGNAAAQATAETATMLAAVWTECRPGIMKTTEKPLKAANIYRENVYASLWLIEQCMPLNECVDFCKRTLKSDGAEVYQLQLVKAIHLKALHSDKLEVRRTVYESFVEIGVQLLGVGVLQQQKQQQLEEHDAERVQQFAWILADWLRALAIRAPGAIFARLIASPAWQTFGKLCLKWGMQPLAKEKHGAAVLLKLLALLCDRLYADDVVSADCERLFEMVLSHSAFFSIALGQGSDSGDKSSAETATAATELKTNLMYLLYVLVKKVGASVLQGTHVPVLLGAYQAKLSDCDRYVLAVLQLYERAGIDMHPYKPFVWGESAISFYAIRGDAAAAKASLNQEPPLMQVMSMVDRDTAELTLAQFPVWRKLNAFEQVPEPTFHCLNIPGAEHLDLPTNSANRLERIVDSHLPHDVSLELLATRTDASYANIYDPAFFVSIMAMSFAPETFARPVRPAQNGLLALTFASLSSQDKAMRLAGASALQRYRSHMHSARFVDSTVWWHLFECVHNGIGELTANARGRNDKKPNRIPRVPYVAGCFLGRTVNVLNDPLNEMYRPLSSFLMMQQAYGFLVVPEFNVLFNSKDTNHIAHRHFVLGVLRDGLKCGSDFTVLMAGNIFKALFGFYGTPMSTRDTNLLVLTVLLQAVRIPRSAKVLIEQVGVLTWLSQCIDAVTFFQIDVVEGLCSVLSSLFYSWRYLSDEYAGTDAVRQRLCGLLVKLCAKLSTRTERSAFAKFVRVLEGVTTTAESVRSLSETDVKHLIWCAAAHCTAKGRDDLGAVDGLTFVQQSNGRYAESRHGFARRRRTTGGCAEQVVFIETALREVILRWRRAQVESA